MATTVRFQTEPTNLDHLIADVRLRFGDFTGSVFSDTIIRTALTYGVKMLGNRWLHKYQVYTESLKVEPQPTDIDPGTMQIYGKDGLQFVPDTLIDGDIFRNSYIEWSSPAPLLEPNDELAIVLAAKYILRNSQVSSDAGAFVSWSTEDIRYSNLGSERTLARLLEADLAELNALFGSKIAKPTRANFSIIGI